MIPRLFHRANLFFKLIWPKSRRQSRRVGEAKPKGRVSKLKTPGKTSSPVFIERAHSAPLKTCVPPRQRSRHASLSRLTLHGLLCPNKLSSSTAFLTLRTKTQDTFGGIGTAWQWA